ncbi:hypothetical protein ACOJVP_03765, partial [Mycobacterium sp. THU-M116]
MNETSRCGDAGVFPRLGRVIVRWPWLVIVCWAALAGILSLTMPSLEEVSQNHPVDILPQYAPSSVANERMTAAFAEAGSDSLA